MGREKVVSPVRADLPLYTRPSPNPADGCLCGVTEQKPEGPLHLGSLCALFVTVMTIKSSLRRPLLNASLGSESEAFRGDEPRSTSQPPC